MFSDYQLVSYKIKINNNLVSETVSTFSRRNVMEHRIMSFFTFFFCIYFTISPIYQSKIITVLAFSCTILVSYFILCM